MTTKIERIMAEKKIVRFEGETGVQDLCRLIRAATDCKPSEFSQFSRDGSHGDLLNFLVDNPGAQEKIYEFLLDFHDEEEEQSEDEEEKCNHGGPTVGGYCSSCGHAE